MKSAPFACSNQPFSGPGAVLPDRLISQGNVIYSSALISFFLSIFLCLPPPSLSLSLSCLFNPRPPHQTGPHILCWTHCAYAAISHMQSGSSNAVRMVVHCLTPQHPAHLPFHCLLSQGVTPPTAALIFEKGVGRTALTASSSSPSQYNVPLATGLPGRAASPGRPGQGRPPPSTLLPLHSPAARLHRAAALVRACVI